MFDNEVNALASDISCFTTLFIMNFILTCSLLLRVTFNFFNPFFVLLFGVHGSEDDVGVKSIFTVALILHEISCKVSSFRRLSAPWALANALLFFCFPLLLLPASDCILFAICYEKRVQITITFSIFTLPMKSFLLQFFGYMCLLFFRCLQ